MMQRITAPFDSKLRKEAIFLVIFVFWASAEISVTSNAHNCKSDFRLSKELGSCCLCWPFMSSVIGPNISLTCSNQTGVNMSSLRTLTNNDSAGNVFLFDI